jgi:hypothetical protein
MAGSYSVRLSPHWGFGRSLSLVTPPVSRLHVTFVVCAAKPKRLYVFDIPRLSHLNLEFADVATPAIRIKDADLLGWRNCSALHCGRDRPRRISLICPSVTPYRIARLTPLPRVFGVFLISITASLLSLALACFSPRLSKARPFFLMSRIFSDCVPRNKWSGFTQSRMSHVCKTHIPSGIGPRNAIQETRCALTALPPAQESP